MSSGHLEPTEPRIVKKKKSHSAPHGGAWKVAYADFVTAMMALFIVLWIMSQSQSVRQNVAQYFKNPGILPGATGVLETSDISGKIPTPGHSQELQTPTPITPDITSEKGSLEEVKKRISEVIAQLPELSRLKDQVRLEITKDGLRLELVDRENSHVFAIGRADLKPETKEILKTIAQELGNLPNRLTIEGHTDGRPYGGQNYTNWELSADRANSARRILESFGVKAGQVTSVRGCADRQLRNRKNPLDFQNRRVSIVVNSGEKNKTEPLDLPGWEKLQKTNNKKTPSSTTSSTAAPPAESAAQAGKPSPDVVKPEKAVPSKAPDPKASKTSGDSGATDPSAKAKPKQEARTTSTPTKKSAARPSIRRLDEQVREELQQLMQSPGASRPKAPGETSRGPAEPRTRLGW